MVGDRSLTSQPAAQEAAARREEAPDVHECFLDVEVMKDRDHRDQIDRSSNLTQGCRIDGDLGHPRTSSRRCLTHRGVDVDPVDAVEVRREHGQQLTATASDVQRSASGFGESRQDPRVEVVVVTLRMSGVNRTHRRRQPPAPTSPCQLPDVHAQDHLTPAIAPFAYASSSRMPNCQRCRDAPPRMTWRNPQSATIWGSLYGTIRRDTVRAVFGSHTGAASESIDHPLRRVEVGVVPGP